MAEKFDALDGNERAQSAVDWLQANWKKIAFGVAAVVVVVAVVGIYQWNEERNAVQAESAFYRAQSAFASQNTQLAQTDLGRVVDQFQGTAAATQAAMLLAQTFYDEQKWDEGIAALRRVEGDRSSRDFAGSVQSLIGAGLEGKGDFAGAAAAYLAAAEATEFDLDGQAFRTDAARAYAEAGNTEAAVGIWRELLDLPNSPYAPEARVRLGELLAQPAQQS